MIPMERHLHCWGLGMLPWSMGSLKTLLSTVKKGWQQQTGVAANFNGLCC